MNLEERNRVFATNSNFKIPISLLPDNVNPWYFKLRLFDLTELKFLSTKGLQWRVAKI